MKNYKKQKNVFVFSWALKSFTWVFFGSLISIFGVPELENGFFVVGRGAPIPARKVPPSALYHPHWRRVGGLASAF